MKHLLPGVSVLNAIALFLLVTMWAFAGSSKLFTYQDFRFELLGHAVLAKYAFLVAWLVPAIELIIALGILIPSTRNISLKASAGLLAIFTLYIFYMFRFYPKTPCSCGGIISLLGWKEHIVFNLAYLFLSLLPLFLMKSINPHKMRA